VGESIRKELFSVEPIDTGRRQPQPDMTTPPFLPGGQGIPGIGNQSPQPAAPIVRQSFLSAFLSNLGPALAGGMAAQPGAPFGTGLGGALAGIDEQKRYNQLLQITNADRARQNALAASTIANQQDEARLRQAHIESLQAKPEEKPFGEAFTDASGNRVQWVNGPNGIRQMTLGKAPAKAPTAESEKLEYGGLLEKALTGVPPNFDPSMLQDPKAVYTLLTNSTVLTPQEKNKAISHLMQNPEKSAMSGNLFYLAAQGDETAKKALSLETNQKLQVAKAAQAGLPAGLAGVAPHLVAPAAADAQKAGQAYAEAKNASDDMSTFISLAKSGNKIAYSYSPTEGVLSFNTARGVKRVNMAEIESYGGTGSAVDKLKAFFGKQISGASIPDNVLNDMSNIHEAIRQNAQKSYGDKLQVINETYGSSFKPTNLGETPTGAIGTARGSDGKLHWTDGKADLGVVVQ
jgi:hypothetical protein